MSFDMDKAEFEEWVAEGAFDRIWAAYAHATKERDEATDKALRFDLDRAGIEQRDAEAVELVDVRAQREAALNRLDEWLKFEERSGWALREYCQDQCPIGAIAGLQAKLACLAAEMRKQRPAITAVFDRKAWDLAESLR